MEGQAVPSTATTDRECVRYKGVRSHESYGKFRKQKLNKNQEDFFFSDSFCHFLTRFSPCVTTESIGK